MNGAEELAHDGYRHVAAVVPDASDYDGQAHLNNASIVRFFNDLRISYVTDCIGAWWLERLRAEGYVVAAREVHVLYESEGQPGEQYLGGMKYLRREGKAALLEQRIVEATTGRAVARAWVLQLLVQRGTVVAWPEEYFDAVARIEGRVIESRVRGPVVPFGPPN